MKTLFVYDIKYIKYSNNYYTEGSLGYDKLTEYTKSFGKLKMFTRHKEVDEIDLNKFKMVSGEDIEFLTIDTKGILGLFTKEVYGKLYTNIQNFDMVIIRLPSFLGVMAYKIAKKLKKPCLVEIVGCSFDSLWNHGSIKGKIVAPIMYLITKHIIKNSQYVQYVSERFLQKRYPTKGESLSCSDVIIKDLDDSILKSKLKKIGDKENKDYIFGIVGSLNVDYKGHDTCIKALSLIKDKIDFKLLCLGAGDNKRWLKLAKKYKIDDRIFFEGTLPSGDPVNKWLDSLDIHLIMSKTEGLPRILVEAMGRASISIGSNVGGIPELIDSYCIVEKNNYKKLATKIVEILADKELQRKICISNFNRAKDFETEKLSERKEKFYNEIIKEIKERG